MCLTFYNTVIIIHAWHVHAHWADYSLLFFLLLRAAHGGSISYFTFQCSKIINLRIMLCLLSGADIVYRAWGCMHQCFYTKYVIWGNHRPRGVQTHRLNARTLQTTKCKSVFYFYCFAGCFFFGFCSRELFQRTICINNVFFVFLSFQWMLFWLSFWACSNTESSKRKEEEHILIIFSLEQNRTSISSLQS